MYVIELRRQGRTYYAGDHGRVDSVYDAAEYTTQARALIAALHWRYDSAGAGRVAYCTAVMSRDAARHRTLVEPDAGPQRLRDRYARARRRVHALLARRKRERERIERRRASARRRAALDEYDGGIAEHAAPCAVALVEHDADAADIVAQALGAGHD